jgi:superfamily II DNA/RNA helicase
VGDSEDASLQECGPGGAALRVELVFGGVDYAAQRRRLVGAQPHLITATPVRVSSACARVYHRRL